MSAAVGFARRAREDLSEILAYIGRDNPERAESFAEELLSRAENLAKHPQLGPVLRGQSDRSLREIVFCSYRIIYRYLEITGQVRIVRFWHGARGTPEIVED